MGVMGPEPYKSHPNVLKILQLIPADTYVISTEQVKLLQTELGVEDKIELARLLCIAFSLPSTVSPISHFAAGAIVIGKTGTMYVGFNVEFSQTSLGESIHAELCAISNAVLHNEQGIEHVVTISTPCGHCRQFIRECKNATEIMVHSCSNVTGKFIFHLPITELLPHSFGPSDLACSTSIFERNEKKFSIETRSIPENEENEQAIELAQKLFPLCHAPHSKSWGVIVIIWSQNGNRRLSGGVYLENAAYNPSLGALQCAVVSLLTSNGTYEDIQSVIVFEDPNAMALQYPRTKLVLEKITATSVPLFLQEIKIT